MSQNQEFCPFCYGAVRPWKSGIFSHCLNCRLIIRTSSKTSAIDMDLYQRSWKTPHLCTDETGGTDIQLAKYYARRLAKTLGRLDLGGLQILDFGAGRGAMMNAMGELGANTIAIEPYGYEYLLLENHVVFRKLDELPNGTTFDGVVSTDVVEHLSVPWENLAAMKRILKPSGWIFLATPNCDGLNARIHGDRWREAQRAGHTFLFKPHSITKILRELGYKRIMRLNWFVPYTKNPLIQLKDKFLSILRLDGELRYLAYKE